MNSNMVLESVNVVIGDNLYELKFRVELNPSGSNPQPMDMNNQHEDGGADAREDFGREGRGNSRNSGQQANERSRSEKGSRQGTGTNKGVRKMVQTFQIPLPREGGGAKALLFGDAAAPEICFQKEVESDREEVQEVLHNGSSVMEQGVQKVSMDLDGNKPEGGVTGFDKVGQGVVQVAGESETLSVGHKIPSGEGDIRALRV
jgi:hypothetical protein